MREWRVTEQSEHRVVLERVRSPGLCVGDFVRADTHLERGPAGLVGKVTYADDQKIGVEFPEFGGGHDCDGTAAPGHGWWYFFEGMDTPAYPLAEHLTKIGEGVRSDG